MTTYLQQAQTGVWDVRASFLPAIYIEGVNLAGGIARCFRRSRSTPRSPTRVLDGLDGLIITGGRDVDPESYGQQPHPATDEAVADNRQRDAWEFALLDGAIRRGMPLLGICRGAQVINVALGGTLHQHLPDVVGHTRHQQGNAVFSHLVGTHRAGHPAGRADRRVLRCAVLSPPGHRPARRRPDRQRAGLPTASSRPSKSAGDSFVLAVQWHPEERLDDLRLFAAVVEAAAAYATGKVTA